MENVKNPIIIDQDYCDKDKCEDQVIDWSINIFFFFLLDKHSLGLKMWNMLSGVGSASEKRCVQEHIWYERYGCGDNVELQREVSMSRDCAWERENKRRNSFLQKCQC